MIKTLTTMILQLLFARKKALINENERLRAAANRLQQENTALRNKHSYYCDVVHLIDYTAKEKEVLAYYEAVGTEGIIYKGTRFDSEPEGEHVDVELVTRNEAAEILRQEQESN